MLKDIKLINFFTINPKDKMNLTKSARTQISMIPYLQPKTKMPVTLKKLKYKIKKHKILH
jgi:hypothetical protein